MMRPAQQIFEDTRKGFMLAHQQFKEEEMHLSWHTKNLRNKIINTQFTTSIRAYK